MRWCLLVGCCRGPGALGRFAVCLCSVRAAVLVKCVSYAFVPVGCLFVTLGCAPVCLLRPFLCPPDVVLSRGSLLRGGTAYGALRECYVTLTQLRYSF